MQVKTKDLIKQLKLLKNANNDPHALLSMVTENGFLELSTKNRVLAVESKIPAEGDLIKTTVLLKQTLNTLKNWKSEFIKFNAEVFETETQKYNVDKVENQDNGQPKYISEFEWEKPSKIDNSENQLKKLLDASGVGEITPRAYASVIYFDNDRIIGTDGFRLAYHEIDLSNSHGYCISFPNFKFLTKLKQFEITVSKCKTLAMIEVENMTAYIRLSSVKYPNYKAIIEGTNHNSDIKIENIKNDLKSLLETTDKSKLISLKTEKDKLIFSNGKSEFKTHIEGPGGILDCTVNGSFLLSAIKNSTKSFYIMFRSNDSENPISIGTKLVKTIIVPMSKN